MPGHHILLITIHGPCYYLKEGLHFDIRQDPDTDPAKENLLLSLHRDSMALRIMVKE